MNILLIDNYDSFTYNLCDYLLQTGASVRVVRNDAPSLRLLHAALPDALVFSPGPKRPTDAGLMPYLIKKYYDRLPMLGICLGHQALGEFFGARLIHAALPVHGKTAEIRHEGNHPLFQGIPTNFRVMRYHSLLLESLDGTPLIPLAHTASGEIMALAHGHLPIAGVQYHPESILTEYGLAFLKNWLSWAAAKVGKPTAHSGNVSDFQEF